MMESNWVTRNRKTILKMVLLALLAMAIYTVRRDLVRTLTPFLYATVFAYLLNPLINFLQEKGIGRGWSAFITVLIVFLILVAFMVVFIPSLVRDAYTLMTRLSGGVQNLRGLLDDGLKALREALDGAADIDRELNNLITNGVRLLSDAVFRLLPSMGGLFDVLVIPVITFYMLKDKQSLLQDITNLFPVAQQARLRQFGLKAREVLDGYVRGKLIISAMVGLLTGVGCLVLGVPNSLTIGLVVGLFDLIPYFGPWLGGTLPVIISLMTKPPITALWVVILILVVQQLEINFITPRVISKRVGLHPLLVMFSVMFFGAIMGIPGMIVGVPIMAVAVALLRLLRKRPGEPAPAEPLPEPPAPEPEGETTT